jgi:diguanylate cyclase (GGDEF)-like protein
MGLEQNQPHDRAGNQQLPVHGQQAIAGSEETAGSHLLDPADVDNVRVLRAVLQVSQAVLGAHRFSDALEVIAEQTRAALGAASLSISRWQRERGVLHTMINVGDLGPGEQRWPTDEEYPLADYREVTDLLGQGRPYLTTLDDDDIDPADESLLRRLNKYSELAVPVMYQGTMWGELWASGADGRRFSPDDVQLLQAIAAQISVAIGTTELFSEVSRYAYQDPLTGLANRRKLDEYLHELRDSQGEPTLLACDLDGLKEVNDREGHTAGDALLRGVAGVLIDVASAYPASLVARMGGDEFCIVLPAASLTEAERFAHAASGQITREVRADVSACWGAAAGDFQTCTGDELIAAADAALLEAKRLGPGRLRLRAPGDFALPVVVERRRGSARLGRRVTDDVIARVVGLLDQTRPSTTQAALELLASELSDALSAAGWTISVTTGNQTAIRAVCGVAGALNPNSGLRVLGPPEDEGVVYPLAEYPSTAQALAEGSAFTAGVDLPGSDPAEVRVLHQLGYRALLAVGLFDQERGYLIEIYFDTDHTDLIAFAPHARVLAHYCVRSVPGGCNSTRPA